MLIPAGSVFAQTAAYVPLATSQQAAGLNAIHFNQVFSAVEAAPVLIGVALSTTPTPDPSLEVVVVATSHPGPDGSIVHLVQPGQSPWSIAIAYGMKIQDLAALNPSKLSETNLVLYPGEELVIRMAFTPTISPTITLTPIPPTHTPQFTYTPRPTRTLAPTLTATEKPLLPEIPSLKNSGTSPIGLILIVVCGVGLLVVIAVSFRK